LPFKKKCIFEHNLESILPLDLVCKFTWWVSRLRGELGPWCHSLSDGAVVDIICFSWGVLYKVQMPPGPLSLHPCCWFHIWLCTLWMQNSVWPCPLHTRAHTHTHTLTLGMTQHGWQPLSQACHHLVPFSQAAPPSWKLVSHCSSLLVLRQDR
jgi:hypothetical protein